jgi:4a-hydroxytetrahydrobiopterin dehydratase
VPAAPLLPEAEVLAQLVRFPAWRLEDGRLVREVRCRDFADAVSTVVRLVPVADGIDHHPDVEIHWDLLTLRVWTHAVGGITRRDVRLLEALEPLLPS